MRVAPSRTVTKEEYTDPIARRWTPDTELAWDDLKDAILLNPYIQRFDYRKLVVLRTDFSSLGFGLVLLQPGNDEASVKAAQNYRLVKDFPSWQKAWQQFCNLFALGHKNHVETE